MKEIIIKEDKNILKAAKRIFGEVLVSNAFIAIYRYHNMSKEEIKRDFNLALSWVKITDEKLSYDSTQIVIEFVTGRKVFFQNSEWASMKELSKDDYENEKELK